MKITKETNFLIASAVFCFSIAFLVNSNSLNIYDCVIDITRPLTSPIWQYVDDAFFLIGLTCLIIIPVLKTRNKKIEMPELFK